MSLIAISVKRRVDRLDRDHHQHRAQHLPPDAEPGEAGQQQRRKAQKRRHHRQGRLADPLVPLGQQPRARGAHLVGQRGRRRQQLGRRELGDAPPSAAAVEQRPQVVGQVVEAGDRQRPPLGVQRLHHAVQHHQLGPGLGPDQQRALRRIGRVAARAAGIGQEDLAQLALGADLADEDRQPGAGVQELALAQQARGDVLGDLAPALGQRLHRGGHDPVDEAAHQRRHDQPEVEHRPRQAERPVAGGLHHHQLAVLAEAVGDVDRRRHRRHRQHQADDVGQAEQRELDEHRRRLAVGDQLVEEQDRAVDPVDQHQDEREEAEHLHQLRQHVAVEPGHRVREPPCFGRQPSRSPRWPELSSGKGGGQPLDPCATSASGGSR